jgi:hypothetical protein
MRTRRQFLGLAGGLAGGALLAGCTERATVGIPDRLLVDTAAGLTLVGGRAAKPLGTGLATPAGNQVWATRPAGNDTVLASIAATTGETIGRTLLAGRWIPRVVSPDGQRVALSQPRDPTGDGPYRPGAHTSTILIADATGELFRLELPGDLEPDAFARAGQALFVLEWLHGPDRYRVRLVDLATRAFTEMLTRDKQPVPVGTEEQMYATGRLAVLNPGGTIQYTLYQQERGPKIPSESPAFVHTLDLTVGWAYCLDLPGSLGNGPAEAMTIAVTPDGRRVAVADLSSGQLAIADTDSLTVKWTLDIPTGTGTAYAVTVPGSELMYLGIGRKIVAVDLGVLNTVGAFDAGGPVRGLAVGEDVSRLFVGYPDAIGWLDGSENGKVLGRFAVPGLTQLRRTV